MKRLTQIILVGVLLLAMLSIATAQRAPEPVVRIGNFFEVGNDVFMHIIATTEMRYLTMENRDFEAQVRDRPNARFPHSVRCGRKGELPYDRQFRNAPRQLLRGQRQQPAIRIQLF